MRPRRRAPTVVGMPVKPIPDGFHSVTPSLTVERGTEALDFYARAFGATIERTLVMGGKLMYGEVRIGDSLVMVSDPFPDYGSVPPDADGPVPAALMIYTEDVDALYARAVEAGGARASGAPA